MWMNCVPVSKLTLLKNSKLKENSKGSLQRLSLCRQSQQNSQDNANKCSSPQFCSSPVLYSTVNMRHQLNHNRQRSWRIISVSGILYLNRVFCNVSGVSEGGISNREWEWTHRVMDQSYHSPHTCRSERVTHRQTHASIQAQARTHVCTYSNTTLQGPALILLCPCTHAPRILPNRRVSLYSY